MYGIYNSVRKAFQFSMVESSKHEIKNKLFHLIGHDMLRWRFVIKPLNELSSKLIKGKYKLSSVQRTTYSVYV